MTATKYDLGYGPENTVVGRLTSAEKWAGFNWDPPEENGAFIQTKREFYTCENYTVEHIIQENAFRLMLRLGLVVNVPKDLPDTDIRQWFAVMLNLVNSDEYMAKLTRCWFAEGRIYFALQHIWDFPSFLHIPEIVDQVCTHWSATTEKMGWFGVAICRTSHEHFSSELKPPHPDVVNGQVANLYSLYTQSEAGQA